MDVWHWEESEFGGAMLPEAYITQAQRCCVEKHEIMSETFGARPNAAPLTSPTLYSFHLSPI